MELVLVPLSAHGNFYEGDCYIILSVSNVLLSAGSSQAEDSSSGERSGVPSVCV